MPVIILLSLSPSEWTDVDEQTGDQFYYNQNAGATPGESPA